MKCPNCGKEEFEEMSLIYSDVLATHGSVKQLVESYACMNCGRVELYVPKKWIDNRLEEQRVAAEKRQAEAKAQEERALLLARLDTLEVILKDETRTLKELKEAYGEFCEIQRKLGIHRTSPNPNLNF